MIPPDFNNFSGTFLILSQSKHWDRYVKKAFDERYTGTYLLVDKSELDDTYADLETYRYTMGRDLRVISNNSQSEVMWIYDRKDKKKYYSNRTQSFGKLQKSYAAELEKVRKK